MSTLAVSAPVASKTENLALESKPYTAPPKQIWGWALGRVSEFGLIATYGQAMSIFAVGFGLSPIIVGWCMMLPRAVDGILDPIIGHWSDNTHTRWGRRKPFLVGGGFIGAIFLAALWWASPKWSSTAQFTHLLIIGTCLYLCYGAYAMAWNAIGYELSDDYHERSKVAAIGGFVLAGMMLFNAWIYWLALRPVFGNVIWGMRWIGGGMAVVVIVFTIITTAMTKERFSERNARKARVALIPAIRTTLRNRAFAVLLLMKICEILGGRLTGGLAFYLGVYYTCRGDQNLATQIGGIGATLGTVWNFAMLPLVKPCSKLIGKRGALIISQSIGLCTALIALFITTPEHPYWGLIPGLIVAPLLVITGTIAGAILPDICDVDELETGERREGLYTSVMGFVSKLEISLAVVLIGYVVSWAGVDTNINNRWTAATSAKNETANTFQHGESAVLGKDDASTFDTDRIIVTMRDKATENPPDLEISASSESPTNGFVHVGSFKANLDVQSPSNMSFAIPRTSARYLKVSFATPQPHRSIDVSDIRLLCTSHTEAASGATAIRVIAARPPEHVVNRLFWLVMLPGIFFAGATLLITLLFPLTESKMLQVRRELDLLRARRNEQRLAVNAWIYGYKLLSIF